MCIYDIACGMIIDKSLPGDLSEKLKLLNVMQAERLRFSFFILLYHHILLFAVHSLLAIQYSRAQIAEKLFFYFHLVHFFLSLSPFFSFASFCISSSFNENGKWAKTIAKTISMCVICSYSWAQAALCRNNLIHFFCVRMRRKIAAAQHTEPLYFHGDAREVLIPYAYFKSLLWHKFVKFRVPLELLWNQSSEINPLFGRIFDCNVISHKFSGIFAIQDINNHVR